MIRQRKINKNGDVEERIIITDINKIDGISGITKWQVIAYNLPLNQSIELLKFNDSYGEKYGKEYKTY